MRATVQKLSSVFHNWKKSASSPEHTKIRIRMAGGHSSLTEKFPKSPYLLDTHQRTNHWREVWDLLWSDPMRGGANQDCNYWSWVMGFTEHFVFICLKSSIMKSFALCSSKFLKIFNMLAKDLGALYLSNSGDSPCCPPPEPHSADPSIRGHTEGPSENNPAPFGPPIGGTWRRLAYSFTLHTSLLSEPEKPALKSAISWGPGNACRWGNLSPKRLNRPPEPPTTTNRAHLQARVQGSRTLPDSA